MRKWLLRMGVVLAVVGTVAAGAFFYLGARMAEPGPSLAPAAIVLAKGAGTQAIAQQLREAGVIDSPWLFVAEARISGRAPLLAGEYLFPAHASIATLLDMLRRGQIVVHRFTLAEGLTVVQALRELRQAEGLIGGPGAMPDEGSLMPQTYFYTYGDSRETLVLRMTRAMNEALDDLWPKRRAGLPLANKMEALILASIVERETALPEERPHIAAVFLNRLKLGMKLQSDPTTIYGLSQGEGVIDRPLSHADLAVANPYNTYVAGGLPPGPICNPGAASLAAVLNPASSNDLYFVADGNGGHSFSATLADHNRNVARLRGQQNRGSEAKAPVGGTPRR